MGVISREQFGGDCDPEDEKCRRGVRGWGGYMTPANYVPPQVLPENPEDPTPSDGPPISPAEFSGDAGAATGGGEG